ncbi:helix-turn-helix domain-containing protein [Parasphingorhabdus halotolerans]|uniref:AraC family transcriptional regulator n=1 Tax=Parasphingorhabdus halotolerans TaxID=2725558 RepID=A0A6H2DNF3_9SPHN|nr:helix-turn-helix domain-containing protein [Parasphingorhabdus halotolerans]QJB69718.1 AraC family transcriptional regulator [Parasphingorhabdus halotolerans]
MSSLNSAPVTVRFFLPDEALKPYISTLYLTEVNIADSERVSDYLHPEWANLRFFNPATMIAAVGDQEPAVAPAFGVLGPTSKATYFSASTIRMWGIGLLPLGWAKFIGKSAEDYVDRTCDGDADPAFGDFAPLRKKLFGSKQPDPKNEAAALNRHLAGLLESAPEDDILVRRAHEILVDPDLVTVQAMADRLNITGRTLDRLSRRAFGFAPKLLLQRQRFLRSLAENMLNPSQNWISSLDPQYYDQAHFGRDFKRFMGMSATEYKAQPHPFMNAAVHSRMAAAGAGMQVLHDPAKD